MEEHVHKITAKECLCVSSGLDLNCVSNGKLLCFNTFEDILATCFKRFMTSAVRLMIRKVDRW